MERRSSEVSFHLMSEGDLRQLREWRNSPEVARYMYTDHTISEEEHLAWFDRLQKQNAGTGPFTLHMVVDYMGKPAGLVAFTDIQAGNSATWAFYLGDPGMRGKGLGKILAYNVMTFAFSYGPEEVAQYPNLSYEVLATNTNVVGLFESMGYVQSARQKGRAVKDGKPVDALTYYMHEREWRDGKRQQLEARLRKDGYEPEDALSQAYGSELKRR